MVLRLMAAVVLIAAVAGCGGSEDQAAPVVEPVVETETAPAGRTPAPDVTGTTLDGESISLGDLRGRPVLINVWSSW